MKKGFPILALAAAFVGLGGQLDPRDASAPAVDGASAANPSPTPIGNMRGWSLGSSWHGTGYKPRRQRTNRGTRVDAARVRAAFGHLNMSKKDARAWVRAQAKGG